MGLLTLLLLSQIPKCRLLLKSYRSESKGVFQINYCQSKEEQKKRADDMTHEERLSHIKKMNVFGYRFMTAAIVCFLGMTAILWQKIGMGAIGVGIIASCGLWFCSYISFQARKDTLAWDESLEQFAV